MQLFGRMRHAEYQRGFRDGSSFGPPNPPRLFKRDYWFGYDYAYAWSFPTRDHILSLNEIGSVLDDWKARQEVWKRKYRPGYVSGS